MIRTYPHLEKVVKYTVAEMNELLKEKEKYYYHFHRLKGVVNGEKKFRRFEPSRGELRDLQNRIQSKIFQNIPLPFHVHGGVRGRGNVTNTTPHRGKLYKFHTDLKSYFEFVGINKVYDVLQALDFSQKVGHLLTELTTFKGHLPQGAPTSPFLANVVGLEMDRELISLCEPFGMTYTRFVDDLCFSSQKDFKSVIPEIVAIVNKHDFLIGYNKTKYKMGRLEVTGVDIGQNVLRPTKKQLEKYYDPQTADHTRKGLDIYFAGLKN